MNNDLPLTPNHQSLVAYIPVLHQGYLNLFKNHPGAKNLYLIGEEYTQEYRPLQKDIRALSSEMMKKTIEALDIYEQVEILNEKTIEQLKHSTDELIFPYEDISLSLSEVLFPEKNIIFDPIFLRWDKKRTVGRQEVVENEVISQEKFDQEMMQAAVDQSQKSSDWWRQVGALIIKEKKIIAESRNIHVPYDYQQYIDGDPRANFSSGELIELSSSIHAESACIAEMARVGESLEGASMYTSTFPCPVCAKLIAYSGIKKLYYLEGYSLIDGENILESKGVEIVRVKVD